MHIHGVIIQYNVKWEWIFIGAEAGTSAPMNELLRMPKSTYLPPNASILIVGKVVTNPAIDLTEGHLLGRG